MSDRSFVTTDLTPTRRGWHRRDVLRSAAMGIAGAGLFGWQSTLAANAATLRRQGKACILLWMQGGPSQLETFDPKPEHANGGETRAIETNVSGIRLSENLPQLARRMDKVALLRGMTGKEGSHPRASFLMHTGYLPTAALRYPTLGANVAHQLGDPTAELPSFVRIGRGARADSGGGYLGVKFDPLVVADPTTPPENTAPTTETARFRRRLSLVEQLESTGSAHPRGMADHRELLGRASTMILSPSMSVFDLERESEADREAYGDTDFGRGCLLARRLVESGVTFVEVGLGNWDTHQDNFEKSRELCGQLDQPFARLIEDLEQRGLLESTLVLCMGEFGRTPKINPRGGRDHFPRAFSTAIAGGGVRGGQVIGGTDDSGSEVIDRPVEAADLFRSVYRLLGIDPDHENMSGVGRPIPLVTGGEFVQELVS